MWQALRQAPHLEFLLHFPYSLGSQSGSVVVAAVAVVDAAVQVLAVVVAAVEAVVARDPFYPTV